MRNQLRQGWRASRAALSAAPGRAFVRQPPLRVGWVTAATLSSARRTFRDHQPPVSMRVNNTAFWITANASEVRNEVYRSDRTYDVVVFFKAMDERCQIEAQRIKGGGGRVIFDANVNYYEVWGDYTVEGTKPTEQQQRDAVAMTGLADWVVADSTYLLDVVRRINPNASWIPDNVDLRTFRGRRQHERRSQLRLIWSGMAHKSGPFLSVIDALAMSNVELVLVSNAKPTVFDTLREALPCSYVRFSERRYASELARSDVIVSPKTLENAYEMAHTEYKITPGMAIGLPAVASPQQSYVEAIDARNGGVVAQSVYEWRDALESLRDSAVRSELGARAAETVRRLYSTEATARIYLDLIRSLAP